MFFVTGLPRSRTAWLAAYLSVGSWRVHHELMAQVDSREAFIAEMERPMRGNCDSGLYLAYDDLAARWPQARWVIVHRPIDEVDASLRAIGIDQRAMLEDNLAAIERMHGLHIQYSKLDRFLPDIVRYVGIEYDAHRAALFQRLRVAVRDLCPKPEALALWSGTRA